MCRALLRPFILNDDPIHDNRVVIGSIIKMKEKPII